MESTNHDEGALGKMAQDAGKSAKTALNFYKIIWIDANGLNKEN